MVVFSHMLAIKINVRGKAKKLTNRKFFGSYYHTLIHHSAQQYQIISGRSINTKSEESTFNSLKTFTNLTSNHHSDHVVVNALVQTQAKEAINPNKLHNLTDEKNFKNLYLPIKRTLCDTIISFTWIKRYFRDCQTLLENIADYLADGTKCWVEEDSGVKFLDLSNISHTKKLHHFCFSSIKAEDVFVKKCWKKYLDKSNLIPAYKVVINDEEMFLDTLHHFKRFLPNTTNKENLITDNKKSSSTCVSTRNPDCFSHCIIMKKSC